MMRKLLTAPFFVSLTLCFCLFNAAAQEPNKTPATVQGTPQMRVTKSEFGKTVDGKTVDKYLLDNGKGITAEVLTLGGVIYTFSVPDKNGQLANISANLETVADYEKVRPFFGALVGRYGNRIAKGKFNLDGKEYMLPVNNGVNSLHGGFKGFDTKVWNAKELKTNDYVGLELTYTSADGEEGYPGTLNATVQYILDNQNRWTMAYGAITDKPTVLNLTNHTFWNLAGFPKDKSISNHEHILRLNADRFLPTDDTLIPIGELKEVAGTPLDFRTPHKIGERIAQVEGAHFAGGYDHCFILNQEKPGQIVLCAEVIEPNSGRTMTIHTTEPGVQFYSGNFLNGSTSAFGHKYEKHGALCLETQHYPNSPNNATFPSTVLRPGEKYTSVTIHTFGITQ